MQVQKAQNNTKEHSIALSNTKPGDVFRFAHDTVEEALKEDLFFMRINAPETKQVRIINVTTGDQLDRDGDHRVVIHAATLQLFIP